MPSEKAEELQAQGDAADALSPATKSTSGGGGSSGVPPEAIRQENDASVQRQASLDETMQSARSRMSTERSAAMTATTTTWTGGALSARQQQARAASPLRPRHLKPPALRRDADAAAAEATEAAEAAAEANPAAAAEASAGLERELVAARRALQAAKADAERTAASPSSMRDVTSMDATVEVTSSAEASAAYILPATVVLPFHVAPAARSSYGESYGMQEGLAYVMSSDERAVAQAGTTQAAVHGSGSPGSPAAAEEETHQFADAPSSFLTSHPLSTSNYSNFSSANPSANPTPKVSPRAVPTLAGTAAAPAAAAAASSFAPAAPGQRHAPVLPPPPSRSPNRSPSRAEAATLQPSTSVRSNGSSDKEGARPTVAKVGDILEIKSRPALPRPSGMKALDLSQVCACPSPRGFSRVNVIASLVSLFTKRRRFKSNRGALSPHVASFAQLAAITEAAKRKAMAANAKAAAEKAAAKAKKQAAAAAAAAAASDAKAAGDTSDATGWGGAGFHPPVPNKVAAATDPSTAAAPGSNPPAPPAAAKSPGAQSIHLAAAPSASPRTTSSAEPHNNLLDAAGSNEVAARPVVPKLALSQIHNPYITHKLPSGAGASLKSKTAAATAAAAAAGGKPPLASPSTPSGRTATALAATTTTTALSSVRSERSVFDTGRVSAAATATPPSVSSTAAAAEGDPAAAVSYRSELLSHEFVSARSAGSVSSEASSSMRAARHMAVRYTAQHPPSPSGLASARTAAAAMASPLASMRDEFFTSRTTRSDMSSTTVFSDDTTDNPMLYNNTLGLSPTGAGPARLAQEAAAGGDGTGGPVSPLQLLQSLRARIGHLVGMPPPSSSPPPPRASLDGPRRELAAGNWSAPSPLSPRWARPPQSRALSPFRDPGTRSIDSPVPPAQGRSSSLLGPSMDHAAVGLASCGTSDDEGGDDHEHEQRLVEEAVAATVVTRPPPQTSLVRPTMRSLAMTGSRAPDVGGVEKSLTTEDGFLYT